MRVLKPFLILGALGLLSLGVVRLVETRVPTSAAQQDSRRLSRAQTHARSEIRSLAASLDENWIPVVGDREAALVDEMIVPVDDPLLQLERSPVRKPAMHRTGPQLFDQLTMPSSSTSKTRAAPPGMLGGAPRSP
jgi:hypothetical protein